MADNWQNIGIFRHRVYPDYSEYLRVQGEKLDRRPGFAARHSEGLVGMIVKHVGLVKDHLPEGGNVLCLGARVGGEVQGFIECGYFAIGIDINPGTGNPYVLHGDFHHLPFPDKCVDIIYTNSLDHVFDMEKLLSEIRRVLKPVGFFMTDNKGGVAEPEMNSARSDGYDCLEWTELAKLVEYIKAYGFMLVAQYQSRGFTPHGRLFQLVLEQNLMMT